MKSLNDCFKLNNGVEIPCIGFGTWQMPDDESGVDAVVCALETGYRHIDTAEGYQNEKSVGIAIKKSGIPREKIFITSKLKNDFHGYESTLAAFDETLKNLDTDYLDLFLIHWPNPMKFRNCWQDANAATWKAFEELYRAKKIRAIGLSNFGEKHINELMKTAEIAPMVNQIRLCPGDTQDELVKFCREKDIVLEAYSPLGTGKIFAVPEMVKLSEKYNRSIAQICIRWSLQRGYLPLPKSVTKERIKENANVFDFTLSDEDAALIAGLTGCAGEHRDPDNTPF